jgi:cation transport ATPase
MAKVELSELLGTVKATVNAVTGRILVEGGGIGSEAHVRLLLCEALTVTPLNESTWLVKCGEAKPATKAHKLMTKLVIGGAKLLLIFADKLMWGSLAVSPIAGPVAVLSVIGTVITGYDFLRALFRTLTGRSKVTTGTLIGAATLSSLMLRENVTALIVLWLLNVGEYLEILTLRRTRKAIRLLLSTEDDEVWLVRDGVEISIRVKTAAVDDVIAVREGRKIGVDGIIEQGQGYVNEAPITGESMPVIRRGRRSGLRWHSSHFWFTKDTCDRSRFRYCRRPSHSSGGASANTSTQHPNRRRRICQARSAFFFRRRFAGVRLNARCASRTNDDAGGVPLRGGTGDSYGC